MRLVKRVPSDVATGDLTPMIDMTFQLIAFFMVLLNFSDAEQDARINLPVSELARPPDKPFDEPRTLQLTKDGTVLFSGDEVRVGPALQQLLRTEREVLKRISNKEASAVTMIVRADAEARAGQVQEIIRICQEMGFEKFQLRAQQIE